MCDFSSHEPLTRDFTYIDDVIDGLISAIELLTKRIGNCGHLYNLGYGYPVAVEKMINYLEEELDKKASLVSIFAWLQAVMTLLLQRHNNILIGYHIII